MAPSRFDSYTYESLKPTKWGHLRVFLQPILRWDNFAHVFHHYHTTFVGNRKTVFIINLFGFCFLFALCFADPQRQTCWLPLDESDDLSYLPYIF